LSLPSRSRRLRRGSDHWQDNAAYLYGHRLLEAGFYWEAHEVWEAVWMNCRPNSTEKVLLQALIQQANARLKRSMGKENAARRLESMVEALRHEVCARLDGQSDLMGVSVVTRHMQFNA
jgi:predicted metal-dependent hydrolase